MPKLPAIQLYPGDWCRDDVSGCSLAAQGLWLRMMFIAHDSDRYGYLAKNGSPIPPESIARRCGCTPEQYETLLAELERAGVPSRTPEDIIFCRRMVKDSKKRTQTKERVTRHRERKRSLNAGVTQSETQLYEVEDEDENPPVVRNKEPDLKELRSDASFAAGYVLGHLDWTGVEARMTYEDIILRETKQGDDSAEVVSEKMVEARRLYEVASKTQAGFKWPVKAFFQQGIWKQPEQWSKADGSRTAKNRDELERAKQFNRQRYGGEEGLDHGGGPGDGRSDGRSVIRTGPDLIR